MKIRACAAMGLAAGAAATASADIESYLIGWQLNYRQPAAAQLDLFSMAFFCSVSGQPGDAATATATPAATGVSYELGEVAPGVFQTGTIFGDETEMFTEFPLGAYTMTVDGGSAGAQSGDLTAPDPLNLPDVIPQFDPAQFPEYDAIDRLNDYTFRFNTFTSTGNLESVYLEINAFPSTRRVFFAEVGASAGEVLVPAGTLRLNRRFTATLYFLSYVVTPEAGFTAATSNIAAWRTTSADLRTAGNCPPDYNGDGFLDFFDYLDFVEAFELGDPDADYNGDSFLDFFDYNDFVAGFETGC